MPQRKVKVPRKKVEDMTEEEKKEYEEKQRIKEDVIIPVCSKYGITLVTAIGEISQSAVDEAVTRADDAAKRAEDGGCQVTTVILYISDFDPAGQSMPVAAARKIEFSLTKRNSTAHIRLYPIILTYEQCIHYQLPPAPVKETEKRGAAFEKQYQIGGAVELDAAEVPLDETCLFDSKRPYIPQLAMFKQFAGKFGYVVEEEDEERSAFDDLLGDTRIDL